VLVFRISSSESTDVLTARAVASKALFIDPAKVQSVQALELSDYLAKKAFQKKKNIAQKFHLEFLLWLSGRKDITSALREMSFTDHNDILVLFFGTKTDAKKLLKQISAVEKPIGLNKTADAIELEKIALGRIL